MSNQYGSACARHVTDHVDQSEQSSASVGLQFLCISGKVSGPSVTLMLLQVQVGNRARGNYVVIKSVILVRCESSVQGGRLEIYARSVHGQVDFAIRDGIKSIANKVKQLRNKEALYEYLDEYKWGIEV